MQAGDQAGRRPGSRISKPLGTTIRITLQPLDETGWTVLDGQIDNALTAARAGQPDPATETAGAHHAVDIIEMRRGTVEDSSHRNAVR